MTKSTEALTTVDELRPIEQLASRSGSRSWRVTSFAFSALVAVT